MNKKIYFDKNLSILLLNLNPNQQIIFELIVRDLSVRKEF